MEIAESHGLPLVVMLRRAGRFRRPQLSAIVPQRSDTGKVLEDKWHAWVEAESFKRLAFHVMIHDAQTSMSSIAPPMISYTEMSLPFPAPAALWFAKSAETWKSLFLQVPHIHRKLPTLAQCVYDAQPLLENIERLDFAFATDIILYRTWNLIWDYQQLSGAQKQQNPGHNSGGSLMPSAWHQELCRLLQNFRLTISESQEMQRTTVLVEEFLLLNLQVSFEELQVFAGKEGREEARRVYPFLLQWARSRESRQAVWHAAQVLRAALTLPRGVLRDFYAIALYHAGLTLWVYGIFSRGSYKRGRNHSPSTAQTTRAAAVVPADLVFLDDESTAETQRFIALNKGSPALRRPNTKPVEGMPAYEGVPLMDSKAVMELIISVLYQNCARSEAAAAPPLVENLSHLMRDLGVAADRVNEQQ